MAGTEIPGGWGRGRLYLTLHCHHVVGEEGDTVTRRLGKRETVPNTTLSPCGGGRARHCHQEVGEEGDCT